MYTNLDLYYLNLIGIKPWLNKKSQVTYDINADKYKLLILTHSDLVPKEQTLLKQIISFLALDEQYLKHIELSTGKSPKDLALNAHFILAFGDYRHSELPSILQITSLCELLNKPLLKKRLFHLLVSIKDKIINL